MYLYFLDGVTLSAFWYNLAFKIKVHFNNLIESKIIKEYCWLLRVDSLLQNLILI